MSLRREPVDPAASYRTPVVVTPAESYVLEKARLVMLEVDAVGALAEVGSEVMLSSDHQHQNVVAHSNW